MFGGSSSINGMMYVRGHARDYDRWAQSGCRGWSYADVLPYFRRAENSQRAADRLSRQGRPAAVTTPNRGIGSLADAFIEAGQQAGYPYTPDCNGAQQEGFGPMTDHP